ncbi:MAG: hypothetical protein WD470_01985 [Rhodospirillaceae bacterium]
MTILEDLFPDPGELESEAVRTAMARLAAAASGGPEPTEPAELASCAGHVRQAGSKIAAGTALKRMSELLSLAQFGAAPVGRAIAIASRETGDVRALEALFTAEFLVAVVAGAPACPQLLPEDLRARHGAAPGYRSGPEMRAVLDDLLDRAADVVARAAAETVSPTNAGFVRRRSALCARRISRLRRVDPADGRTALSRFDRLAVRLRLAFSR